MPEFFYFFSILSYTLRSVYFVIGAAAERRIHNQAPAQLPFVSVIVPARNEEHCIVHCIESLAALNYPSELLECIVVNDRSSDMTGTIAAMQQHRFPALKVLHIERDGEKNLQGKAGALEYGIRASKGEIIVMTDADCIVDPEWVRSHVEAYGMADVGMVCAYTLIDGQSTFAKMQAVEWTSTHTMASSALHFKQYLGCYGNNLSIHRRAYDAVGGYASIPFSVTEDLALLHAVTKQGFRARYLCSRESSVHSRALETLSEYVSQHKRWAIGGRQLGLRAVVFVITSALFWMGIAAAVWNGSWLWLVLILLTRVVDDIAINAPALHIFRRRSLLPFMVPAVLFFSLLELVLPFLLIDGTTKWKGQVFKS